MKANCFTIISIILVTLLSFFTLIGEIGSIVSPDNLFTESLRQGSYIYLQFVSILENKNEFEEETNEDDLSICIHLKNNNPHDIKFYFSNKKPAFVKEIVFFDKISRSPPFI
jgi:hypothetical protein